MNRPPSVVATASKENQPLPQSQEENDDEQLIQNGDHDQSPHVISADHDDVDETEYVEPPGKKEKFYYVAENGKEEGPVTMVEIVEKFQSMDITEDTLIWPGEMTRAQSKPLKETRRIYANLPKPPKRGQHMKQREMKLEEKQEGDKGRVVPVGNGMTRNGLQSNTSSKSKGCCIV